MAKKKELFDGGIPYGPDIDRIMAHYPPQELKELQVISYDAVAQIINAPAGSNRWRAVTGSWRDKLKNIGVQVECLRNVPNIHDDQDGWIVCDDRLKLYRQTRTAEKNRKAVVKEIKGLLLIDRSKLDDQGKKIYDFQEMRHASIQANNLLRRHKLELPALPGDP